MLTTDIARILETFHAVLGESREFHSRYNIAPTQEISVIVSLATGSRALQWMRWALIPSWASSSSMASSLINARAETAAETPSFKSSFRSRRCVVPATGYYEWKVTGARGKVPHLIELAGNIIDD